MPIAIFRRHDPLASVLASLARFPLLFTIWGTVGFGFKIFMNLSLCGIVISLLFFATCALIMVGLFTRVSTALLGAVLLAKGGIDHSVPNLAWGVLTLLASLFPLGAYYSLDRYLADRPSLWSFMPPRDLETKSPAYAVPLFAALAIFMVGGPTYNQALHHPTEWFRAWDMFHVIGRNFVNAQFFTEKDGALEHLDYVGMLGHKVHTPGVHRYGKAATDMRIVGTEQLESVIARMCAATPDPAHLRVKARITLLKEGWKQLYDGTEPVCESRLLGKLS